MSIIDSITNIFKQSDEPERDALCYITSFEIQLNIYQNIGKALFQLMEDVESKTPIEFEISYTKYRCIIDLCCKKDSIDAVMASAYNIALIKDDYENSNSVHKVGLTMLYAIEMSLNSIIKINTLNLTPETREFLDFHREAYMLDYYQSNGYIYIASNSVFCQDIVKNNLKEFLRINLSHMAVMDSINTVYILMAFLDDGSMQHNVDYVISMPNVSLKLFAFLMQARWNDVNTINFCLSNNQLHIHSNSEEFNLYMKTSDESVLQVPDPSEFLEQFTKNI